MRIDVRALRAAFSRSLPVGAKQPRKPPRVFGRLPPAGAHGTARFEVMIEGWHPAKLNQLNVGHWGRRRKLKDIDAKVLANECDRARVSGAIGKRRVTLTITLAPRQRAADPDAYWKSLLDGLKRCGALREDNRHWVETPPPIFERGPCAKTLLLIEDIDGRA